MEFTKYVLPVIVGATSGMILIIAGQSIMHTMYPLLPGTDLYDADSLALYIKQLPGSAFVVLLVNYVVCAFFAGIITTLVSKRTTMLPAVVIGIILTLSGLYYVVTMPYPVWFSVANLFVYLPFSLLGYRVARKKTNVNQPV